MKPGDCIKDGFDAVCVGEGEYATLELVEQLQEGRKPSGIPNLWIRSNGQFEVNPPRPFLEDLDSPPLSRPGAVGRMGRPAGLPPLGAGGAGLSPSSAPIAVTTP